MARPLRVALAVAALLVVAGFVVVVVAWRSAERATFVDDQFAPLVTGAAVGVGLIVVGAAVGVAGLASAERRRVLVRLDALARAAGATVDDDADLVVQGRSSFHAPSCRLAADGRPLVARAEARAAGLAACRVCQP